MTNEIIKYSRLLYLTTHISRYTYQTKASNRCSSGACSTCYSYVVEPTIKTSRFFNITYNSYDIITNLGGLPTSQNGKGYIATIIASKFVRSFIVLWGSPPVKL